MAKRGRPRKAASTAINTTPAAPEAAQKPSAPNLDADTVKIAQAVTAALRPLLDELIGYLPTMARLAAADTVRTGERPETVFKRAIAEGAIAADVLAQLEANKQA
jgi:hypothetical protein